MHSIGRSDPALCREDVMLAGGKMLRSGPPQRHSHCAAIPQTTLSSRDCDRRGTLVARNKRPYQYLHFEFYDVSDSVFTMLLTISNTSARSSLFKKKLYK